MKAISTLSILPTSKTEIETYISDIKEEILGGYIPAIESAIMLKSFEEIVKALRADEDIKQYLQDSADLYNEKTIDYRGCSITKSERPTYDFKNCEDPEWLSLSMQEMKIKGAKKTREEWLKTLKTVTPDPETGELISPPIVLKTSILSISLKK